MLLPGVQPASEGTSSFSVRGGSPDQNLILFDDATIYNASHLMGFFSVFNNDVVDDVKLYKGDIPAAYGGRLSSLLEVNSKDGDMHKNNVTGGVGLISSRLAIDGPIVKDRLSFMVGGRRTYADLFLKLAPDENLQDAVLHFYDLNGKITFKATDKDRITLTGYYGKDRFGMADMANMDFSNASYTLKWTHRFSDNFFLNSSIIGSQYKYKLYIGFSGSVEAIWSSSINDIGLREDFTYLYGNGGGTFKFGISGTYHNVMPFDAAMNIGTNINGIKNNNKHSTEYSAYAMNQHKLFDDRLTVKYGLRATAFQNVGPELVYYYDENYNVKDSASYSRFDFYNTQWGFEPRAGLAYQLNDVSSVKASYSRTVQFMHLISNSAAGSPLDVWMPSGSNIEPQSAHQGSVGYFRNFFDDAIETSAEVFYKRLDNVVDFKDHANLIMNIMLEKELRKGIGKSYGLELMIRKISGDFSGWVSYTLSRSFREVETVNDNEWYRAPFDKPHNLNIVLSYDIAKRINVSANWTYSTGTPVTFPENRFYVPGNGFGNEGQYVPIYGKRNTYRLPDYHRLDLSANFILNKNGNKNRYYHELNISLYNAYARKNPWYVTFTEEEPTGSGNMYAEMVYLFSIVPSITYNFSF
jgi:hypothetical protein